MQEMNETEDNYIIERVKEIVVEILEFEDNFEHMDELIEQVKRIDFGELDAFKVLAGYIEEFSLRAIRTMYPNCVVKCTYFSNLNAIEERLPDHADVENLKIEPWASSMIGRLWRAITSEDFKILCGDEVCLAYALSVLEIMLVMVDEGPFVPVASSEELNRALGVPSS
jgi:hypothetical protein